MSSGPDQITRAVFACQLGGGNQLTCQPSSYPEKGGNSSHPTQCHGDHEIAEAEPVIGGRYMVSLLHVKT